MSKLLVAVMCGMLVLSGVACQNKESDDSMSGSESGEVKTAKDDCTHCAGTQTAKADGTCPMCGGKPKG